MTQITDLSEEKLQENTRTNINVVDSITSLDGDSITRPLDAGDIQEIQQSRVSNISNHACFEMIPEDNIAVFAFTVRDINLERAIDRREKNDNFPDDVPPEMVIARQASWIATTITSGQHIRRNIGDISLNDLTIEVQSDGGTRTLINIILSSN